MSRTIKCVMLGEGAEGLDYAPYPGELGQRIYDNVSKEAWQQWLEHHVQTGWIASIQTECSVLLGVWRCGQNVFELHPL